jgi:hypothetical protein
VTDGGYVKAIPSGIVMWSIGRLGGSEDRTWGSFKIEIDGHCGQE